VSSVVLVSETGKEETHALVVFVHKISTKW